MKKAKKIQANLNKLKKINKIYFSKNSKLLLINLVVLDPVNL